MRKRKLELQIYGSPLLRKKCKSLKHIDFEVRSLLDDMVKMMRESQGVGLAANQAGLSLALVVIETQQKVYKLINPKINKKEGRLSFTEGCLSFPGLSLDIVRHEEVWVSYKNIDGKQVELKAEGTLAVILQHEIDHINGMVFIDRIPLWRRVFILPQLKKIKRIYRENKSKSSLDK